MVGLLVPLADRDIYGTDIINLYDNNRAMEKYDYYVLYRHGYNPGAKQWESRSHWPWTEGHPWEPEYLRIPGRRTVLRETHAEEDWACDINGDGDLDDPWDFTDGTELYKPDGDTDDSYDVVRTLSRMVSRIHTGARAVHRDKIFGYRFCGWRSERAFDRIAL